MLLLVAYIGDPMGYFCCVLPLVELVFFLISELMLSRICLLTFPSSLFEGFMGGPVGWLGKLSLWSFRVIKACCFAICSVRLSGMFFIE